MEEGYIDTDLLNEEMCEDKHGHYHHSKWIDCYCKPEDHIGKNTLIVASAFIYIIVASAFGQFCPRLR